MTLCLFNRIREGILFSLVLDRMVHTLKPCRRGTNECPRNGAAKASRRHDLRDRRPLGDAQNGWHAAPEALHADHQAAAQPVEHREVTHSALSASYYAAPAASCCSRTLQKLLRSDMHAPDTRSHR